MQPQELLTIAILIIGGFLLGSVMFSQLLPKLLMGRDVCKLGSDHNPGSANAFINCGIPMGLLCLSMDLLKGFLPAFIACKLIDTNLMCFSLIMTAPVLGHAIGLFNHFHGGKCIATFFGVLLGILPVSKSVFLLAMLYIFFSICVKIRPNRYRSIVTFTLYGIISVFLFLRKGRISLAGGCLLMSLTAIAKHTERFCFVPDDELSTCGNISDKTTVIH